MFAVSLRKNALIVLLIVLLCTLLVMQLVSYQPFGTETGGMAIDPPEAGAETATEEEQPEIRLRLDVHLPEANYRQLAALMHQTETALPHMIIEVVNHPPEEARERLLAAADGGELADVVLLDFQWASEFAAAGYLARWPEGSMSAADDPVSRMTGWNGYRWLVPYRTDPYVLAYSGSADSAATGESLPRTVEEWVEWQAVRAADGEHAGLIYADPDDPRAFVSLLWAMGGKWTKGDGGMVTPSEDSLPILELLFGRVPEMEEMDEMEQTEVRPLAVTEKLTEDDMWERFTAGTLPFVIVPLSELESRDLAHKQWPGLVEEAGPLWLGGAGFAVSSQAADPERAFEWLSVLLDGHSSDAGRAGLPEEADLFWPDPELPAKAAVLGKALPALYSGEIEPATFNEWLETQWPAP